jgi:hypothetical protein
MSLNVQISDPDSLIPTNLSMKNPEFTSAAELMNNIPGQLRVIKLF